MAIDMFRLNALIDLLLWEGEDYDPAAARELFEALPLERSSSPGTWVGKWRVIRTVSQLVIEPRFFGDSEDDNGDFFVLPFEYGEPRILYKSVPREICLPIPFFGSFCLTFCRLVKWKNPATPRHRDETGRAPGRHGTGQLEG